MFFAAKPKKNKYRWFKVVGFGGGGLVGSKKSVTCPVSQRDSPVILRKANTRGKPIPPQSYSISK